MDLIRLSTLAGIFIGIAAFGYVVNPVIGIFLFIFGLSAVVSYGAKLFTGTAGYFYIDTLDLPKLFFVILPFNIIGCLLVYLFTQFTTVDIIPTIENIINKRLELQWYGCMTMGIGCGILMTTAVEFARRGKEIGNWIPLLFAVPLFIHCGFPHCIADAFYYIAYIFNFDISWNIVLYYICTVFGNFIGCNIPRIFAVD